MNYFSYLRKLKTGHLPKNYQFIKNAMLELDFLNDASFNDYQKETILDNIKIKLLTNNI